MNAWEGLDAQVDRLVARLRPIGLTIGKAAKDGDKLAQRIVANYTLLHRRVDPVAAHITEEALNEWERRASSSGVKNLKEGT